MFTFEMTQRSRKPGRPTIILPREAIISAYEDGATIRELAEEFGVAFQTLRNRLHEWEVQLRRNGPIPGRERHRYARFVEDLRQQILQLEEAVADKQVEVGKREAELKQAQEKEPKEASAAVTKLKQADVELRDFESKLATLKGVGAR